MLTVRNKPESRKAVLVPFDYNNLTTFKSNSELKNPDNVEWDSIKSLPEWGQLKNLIPAFQFLNAFWSDISHPEPYLVYVGAAPGNNLNVLIQAFPWFNYHLYDIATFDERISSLSNVTIHNKLFNTEDIEYWKEIQKTQKNVFMMFDIRNSKYRKDLTEDEKNEILHDDLIFQMKCVKEIFPVKSLLKIKFPSKINPNPEKSEDETHFSYLDGVAYRHTYTDKNSKDFSLVPHDNVSLRLWNIEVMDWAITHHNIIVRQNLYLSEFETPDKIFISQELGIKNNFDGIILTMTLRDYLLKFSPFTGLRYPTLDEIIACLKSIIKNILPDHRNRLLPKSKK